MYSGIKAKIPLGEYGLLTDVAPDKAPANSLTQALNICYFNGSVQKAPGTIRWNDTPLSAGIVGVCHYFPSLVEPRYIAVTSDGNIYKGRDRQFGTPLNISIAQTPLSPNVVFADGGKEVATNPKKLFIFTNGATLPYVLRGDGTACTTISGPNSDWTSSGTYPKFGVIHRSQLWAFAGQISYASDSLNHEDFSNNTTSIVQPIYPGEGGDLNGAFVFKGRLFAFKDSGFVYSLNDLDTDVGNWFWQKVGSNSGLASPNAIAEVLDDMVTGNNYGTLTSFRATLSLGNVAAADVMQNAQIDSFMRGQTSKSGVQYEHVLYYGEKKLLFMTCRSIYKTTNDSMMVLDFGRSSNVRPAIWTKGSPQCLAKYKDVNEVERPMYGDAAGYLHLMDQMDRLEGTAAYTGAFQTQHLDFSHLDPSLSSAEKQFDFLAVHYIPSSTGNLSCDYFIDGRYIDTVTFPMVQYRESLLGELLLGTDRLKQGNTETSIREIAGTGRTFSAYFYNSGSNESFQIPAITVYFRGGGDKATQL